MGLKDLEAAWNALGVSRPIWSISAKLTEDDVATFWQQGQDTVDYLFRAFGSLGVTPGRGRALDFGCGIGRLTQPLCNHFGQVVGVDISEAMISQARENNREADRCRYIRNVAPDLSIFDDKSFDFICSLLVLQHVGPELAEAYIREFLRLLQVGGICAFQIPGQLRAAAAFPVSSGNPYVARIELVSPGLAEQTCSAGALVRLKLRVTNMSGVTWMPEHWVRLGKQWRHAGTQEVVPPGDDGSRAVLPMLAPGEQAEVDFDVSPPGAGQYLCELDLVQENVAWFRDKGSQTLTVPFTVERGQGQSPGSGHSPGSPAGNEVEGTLCEAQPAEPVLPRIEMHGIDKSRIVELVNGAGGSIVGMIENDWAGPEWNSYLYVVCRQ